MGSCLGRAETWRLNEPWSHRLLAVRCGCTRWISRLGRSRDECR
jgi:hypothetical protein